MAEQRMRAMGTRSIEADERPADRGMALTVGWYDPDGAAWEEAMDRLAEGDPFRLEGGAARRDERVAELV